MSRFLDDIYRFIQEKDYCIYSISESKDGRPPETVCPVPGNACQNSYSVAKVLVVTAVGILFDRGLLTVQSKAVELLGAECPETYADGWQDVTVHMLLSHSAGLEGGALDIDCLDSRLFGRDYLAYMMQCPFAYKPGTERRYSDGAFYMLSRIVEKLSGQTLLSFCWNEMFLKMGVREAAWSTCPMGHCMGATGLYIRSEDLVKIGMLYLQKGIYNGERILSEMWVNRVLDTPYELSPRLIGNIYSKGGMHGQLLFIDPDQNRVVAYHGYDRVDSDAIVRFAYEYNE